MPNSTPAATDPRADIRRFLHPRGVAVVGASDDTAKFGGRVMHYLLKHGYAGRIAPVNPRRAEIMGLPVYTEIREAPRPIDLALLAVPPAALADAIEGCAAVGVGCCIVMTTGFAELGEEGRREQDRLVALARAGGMRLFGPNCMGFVNTHAKLAMTSSLVLDVDEVARGRIGLVSQSGALMVSMFSRAHDAGIGFSACVSLGNQADLEICDLLEYMIADPATGAICLYVEGFVDGPRFLALAEACRAAGKPLLMLKAGRSDAGARAAQSHTASLAGSYTVLEAACRELGVLLIDDPDGLVEAADAILRWPTPGCDGIGLVSPSGGGAAIGFDRLADRGLHPAVLSSATRAALAESMLEAGADNPIDLGARREPDSLSAAAAATAALAADPAVGVLFPVMTTTPAYAATTEAIGRAALESGKPTVVVVTPGAAADGPRGALRDLGVPYYDRLDDGLRVIEALIAHGRQHRAPRFDPPQRPAPPHPGTAIPEGRLTEPQAKILLAAHGIPVTEEQLADSPESAVVAAGSIGYPVALKAVCRGLAHKSDVGAVKLDLDDADAVRAAWGAIQAAIADALPDADLEGCLVQEMRAERIELLVGARHDPTFGPVVVVGAGGTLVELHGDVEVALAPVSIAAARAMLARLSIRPLLEGWRGDAGADLDAAAVVIERLSWLAHDLGERLIGLEINPLMVGSPGSGAVAVDARGTFTDTSR